MLTGSRQLPRQLPTHWIALSVFLRASVQFSSYGNEFLLAAPRLLTSSSGNTGPPTISFFMGTADERGASICVTTPDFQPDNESLHELFYIGYRNISSFTPPSNYRSEVYMGPKWSYRFIGNATFSLAVFLVQDSKSVASFQAVPITSWGKKYVVYTLGQYPSIQIVSNTDDNSILLFFSFTKGPTKVNLTYNNETYSDGRRLHVTLNRWQAFAMSNCDRIHSQILSFTGTMVYGDFPIGVISGNCESKTYTFRCRNSSRGYLAGETADVAVEMFLPEEAFGKEFILFRIPRRTHGSATIMSMEENTEVNITIDKVGGVIKEVLEFPGMNMEVLMDKNRQLVSNKRIQMVITMLSTCLGRGASRDLGDPAICLVLPNSLFGEEYFWSTPDGIKDNYATVIMELEVIKYIHINNVPLRDYECDSVMGNQNYEVSTFRLFTEHNYIFAMHNSKFACYVYGLGPGMQYMHPAGFNGCIETTENMFPGDRLDNDCDGDVDEEVDDGMDNDRDRKVDEDLARLEITDGLWGEWLPWTCNPNCTHPFYYRLRLCDSPPPSDVGVHCQGDSITMSTNKCKPSMVCPRRCPQFTWGKHCNRSCINCGLDCDTETGQCQYCRMGFKRRDTGCNRRCDENEYGHDCLLLCSEKCGTDCANRETGECPRLNQYLFIWLLLIVLTLGFLLLVLKKRGAKKVDKSSLVTIKDNSSEMNVSVLSTFKEAEQRTGVVPGAEAVTPFETTLT